jgi:hypothetical protein
MEEEERVYSICEYGEFPKITLQKPEPERELGKKGFPKAMDIVELANCAEHYRQFYRERIIYWPENNTLQLRFTQNYYPYEIDLDRIVSEKHLLCWVAHLSTKPWMTGSHIKRFIQAVAEIKGYNLHDYSPSY